MGLSAQLDVALTEGKVPEDYAEAKKERDRLDAEAERTGQILKKMSGGGPMGMTPEATRAKPEWQKANAAYSSAFRALQAFNQVFVKRFKKEIMADRRRRYGG